VEERLNAAQEDADEEERYFDPWEWLSAQSEETDVILEQVSESMACGSLTFTSWIGIRKEERDRRSRRLHLVAAADDEFSSTDRRIFFRPTPLFVRWMKTHHSGQHVFDVGCGTGNTASMLAKAGMKVTALDLEPRMESEFDVIKADATEYAFEKGSVLLFCRPCHNGFVEKTLTKGIMCGVADIVYVGLTNNLQFDLGESAGAILGHTTP
jgi:SAM-dependent methyltransferase